jgi:hypothetical protein
MGRATWSNRYPNQKEAPMAEPNEAVRATLEKNREASEKSRAEAEERLTKGKPTPTQEENDLAMLGHHVLEHEDDGSGPEPTFGVTRQSEPAKKPAGQGYQTRAATPQPRPALPRHE